MHLYEPLYISQNLIRHSRLARYMIRHGLLPNRLYLIALSDSLGGQLEYASLSHYKGLQGRKKAQGALLDELRVIGIAYGEAAACSLTEEILAHVYSATGDCNCAEYFKPFFENEKGNAK